MIAARPVALLEQLNSVLQAKSATVSGMLETVKISSESIRAWHSDEVFHEIFITAKEKGETYELDPLEIPRRRCLPKRYVDQVAQYQPASPEEHYRKQYLEFIDAVSKGLSDIYDLS
ncbi:Zinc finger MYM-type protein 1-like [Oopsacas minuta]|uniref:Zinc finger MYM-type protein 1-like n=1 Tax=Oopsacas minuta TaxID=111878 RepID=A0AAV7KB77_9METZ|nr:Zinc finger MYM-type protein 1-like [Oopsacas minuta]